MTRHQRKTLLYIDGFIRSQGISPSYQDIRRYLGISSTSGVHRAIRALAERGYLSYIPNRARSLRILRQPEPVAADVGTAYPATMTPALADVLGMPPYKLHHIWMALREVGQIIRTRYEDEVAAALHFLIPIAIEHPDDWQPAAAARLKAMQAEHAARVANDA